MFSSLHLMFDSLLKILQWGAFRFLIPVGGSISTMTAVCSDEVISAVRIATWVLFMLNLVLN